MKLFWEKVKNAFKKMIEFFVSLFKKVWFQIKKISLIVANFCKKIGLIVWTFVKKWALIIFEFLKKFFSKRKNIYITAAVSFVVILSLILGLALGGNNDNDNDDQLDDGIITVTLIGDDEGGTVSVDKVTSYDWGEEVTIMFTPNSGYYLSQFKQNDSDWGTQQVNLISVQGWTENIYNDYTLTYQFTQLTDTEDFSATKMIPTGNTFSIMSPENLIWLMQVVNGYGSPDISGTGIGSIPYNFSGKTVEVRASLDMLGYKMYPIGYSFETAFKGTFNSNYFPISNLNIASTSNYCGLFGYLGTDGLIEKTYLEFALINGTGYVGGFVGTNNNGGVENCAIVGVVYGTGNYVGGIVGFNSSYSKSVSLNTVGATVIGKSSYVGGIVGYGGNIDLCSNYGKIYGENYIGGILGYGNTISNCVNTGMISANLNYAGGIAGAIDNGNISYCYNTGYISAKNLFAGGIAGQVKNYCGVSYSYNHNLVNATRYAGGIAGEVSASSFTPSYISYCYNASSVTANEDKGGIAGKIDNSSTVNNCYYDNGYDVTSLGTNLTESDDVKGLTTTEMVYDDLESYGFSSDDWTFRDSAVIFDQTVYFFPQLKSMAESEINYMLNNSFNSVQIFYINGEFSH